MHMHSINFDVFAIIAFLVICGNMVLDMEENFHWLYVTIHVYLTMHHKIIEYLSPDIKYIF